MPLLTSSDTSGPLRLVHITPSFWPATHYGGPVKSVRDLALLFLRMGARVRVLTTNGNGPAVLSLDTGKETLMGSVPVRYCARTLGDYLSLSLLFCLFSYVRWADIVCLSGVYCFSTWPTLLLGALLRKPVIWLPHGSLMKWGRRGRKVWLKSIFERICNLLLSSRTLMVCLSELEKDQVHEVFPNIRSTVVQPSVQVGSDCNSRPDSPQETMRLLFIGRLDPVKGLDRLLRALKLVNVNRKVAGDRPLARLTVAGNGAEEYRNYIVGYAKHLGVSDDVEFLGSVSEDSLPELFRRHDVTVAPSHSENFCYVIAESISYGVPVIVSRGTPWREVEQIGCGLCVENSDAAISAAIQQLHALPLKEMGNKGREWIAKQFSAAAEQQRWQHLFGEMTAKS
jgi:glycosyltransferase involved in cell wall biosynthesis